MFLCFLLIKNNEKWSGIDAESLEAFQNQAVSWSQINVSFELEEHSFNEVLNSLNGFDKQHYKQKIIVHISYRVSFRNKNKT